MMLTLNCHSNNSDNVKSFFCDVFHILDANFDINYILSTKFYVVVCDAGKWGDSCNKSCECNPTYSYESALCNNVNEQCRCKAGYEGFSCDKGKQIYFY